MAGLELFSTERLSKFLLGQNQRLISYIEIGAADGDIPYTQSIVNQTLSGSANTAKGRMQTIGNALTPWGVTVPDSTIAGIPVTPPNPRPTVMYGMGADMANIHASSIYAGGQPMQWSIQNGQFILTASNNGIPDTTAFVLNSLTGLIGFPNTTSDGIEARTLLNPAFGIRRPVIINNAIINQTLAAQGGANVPGFQAPVFPGPADLNYFMDPSSDGTYIIYVVEHHGDSRGNDWYSDLVLVSVDKSGKETTAYSGIPTQNGS